MLHTAPSDQKSANPVRCAAILAGGKSSRMGRDKALIELNSEPLVRRTSRVLETIFERVVVVSNSQEVARAGQLARIADAHHSKGPLAGIQAALRHFNEATFIAACDLPFLNADFIRFQSELWRDELDALVPEGANGIEPLHAIWSPSCLPAIEEALGFERPPSLRRVLGDLKMETIAREEVRRFDATFGLFENWNSPDDVRLDLR